MKKTSKKKVESVKTTSPTTGTHEIEIKSISWGATREGIPKEVKKIDKLEIDLGRGDLNLLRDKLNELIDKQNGC